MPRQSPRVAAQLAGAVSDVHADGSTTHDHDHAAAEMAAQSLEAARLEKDARRRGKELEHAECEERAAEYGLGGAASCAKEQSAGRQQQSQLSHAEDASTAAGPSGAAARQSPEDRETLPPSGESGGATSTPLLFYTQLLVPAREEVLAMDDRWSEAIEPLGGGTPSSGDVLLLCEECCAQLHRAYASGLEFPKSLVSCVCSLAESGGPRAVGIDLGFK